MIPLIVISLTRTPDRRASIASQLSNLGVPFAVLDAVDGRQLGRFAADRMAPKRQRLTLRWPLSDGEIGCAASHRLAIQRAFDAGYDWSCIIEDDAKPAPDFPLFLDPKWLTELPSFDILKLACDIAGPRELRALPLATRAGRRVCVPLHPSYSARCYVLSRDGAARALRRLRVIDDSLDVMLFRRPMTDMRFLDVRPMVVDVTHAESTLAPDRWHNAPAPWWRPLLSWGPHRLALIERKARRYFAFARAQGVHAFQRLESISLDNSPDRQTQQASSGPG